MWRCIVPLPPAPGLESLPIRDQARAVLSLVFEHLPASADEIPEDPTTCPNCDCPAASTRSPYCGEACREEAGFVRQVRTGLREEWLRDEEKQIALGQVLWHLLGGGRPFRQSIIPESAKKRALARTGGLCASCGERATGFDHEGSGCNRDINLRPVCANCAETKPFGDPGLLARPEIQTRLRNLAARIGADAAVRVCDDAEIWDWRAYLARRISLAGAGSPAPGGPAGTASPKGTPRRSAGKRT